MTGSRQTGCADFLFCLVKVERVAVKVSEHMILKHLLVAVQWELLAAHGADFPVTLHVLLELALVIVGREDDLTQRASLHVHAAHAGRGGVGERQRKLALISSQAMMWANQECGPIKSICLMRRGWPAA